MEEYKGGYFSPKFLKKDVREKILSNPEFAKLIQNKWRRDRNYKKGKKIPPYTLNKLFFDIKPIREYIFRDIYEKYPGIEIDMKTGHLISKDQPLGPPPPPPREGEFEYISATKPYREGVETTPLERAAMGAVGPEKVSTKAINIDELTRLVDELVVVGERLKRLLD
jgi:hypothetical protein